MRFEERIAKARKLMRQAKPTERIFTDASGNIVLIDIGKSRHEEEINRNARKPKVSKNEERENKCIARRNVSNKNKRFARDEDFGQ